MRAKLFGKKRCSERWCKIANDIFDVSESSCAIPDLKSGSGWAYSPIDKADLFADTFASNFVIPRREFTEHNIE